LWLGFDTILCSLSRHVEPPEGSNFNPRHDLNVKIVFSSPLSSSSSDSLVAVSRESDRAMYQSVYLYSTRNATKIFPSLVSTPVGNPIPDDLTGWLFTFPNAKVLLQIHAFDLICVIELFVSTNFILLRLSLIF
jgi:hypothetical protein